MSFAAIAHDESNDQIIGRVGESCVVEWYDISLQCCTQ